MQIRVLKDQKAACESGLNIVEYKAGDVVDMYDGLANIFIDNNWGEEVKAKVINSKEEKKLKKLDNKAVKNAPENKGVK